MKFRCVAPLSVVLLVLICGVVLASDVTVDSSTVSGGVHTAKGKANLDKGHTFVGLSYFVKDSAGTVHPGYINLPKGPPAAGGSADYTGTSKTFTTGKYDYTVQMSYTDENNM